MASLLEIKKKIGGVKNTRKITKAMELVAASKMRQFQKKAVAAREYVTELLSVLEHNLGSDAESIYTEQRETGPTLYVLYTSDKGLCGALNTKLINALFRSDAWNNSADTEKLLVTIGRKSHEFAKNRDIPVAANFNGIPEQLSDTDVLGVVDEILGFWRENKCKEIIFIAPHYQNSFTFYPVRKTFLPFSEEMVASHLGVIEQEKSEAEAAAKSDFMLFEPGEEQVITSLHELIVQSLFVQAFFELKAAEYSSRMMAMKNATDSANQIIDDLTLEFNKARQAAITQEIAELAGAGAAMADEED